VRSGGGSMARIGLHVGEDWWTFLNTYDDHGPILDIAAGSTAVTFCFDGSKVTAAAVAFARELADKAAKFAAEAERLHTRDRDRDGDRQDGGDGEAP
jgi:hypothetical protein